MGGWKDDAAAAMFKGKALKEGFDAGIAYLEEIMPLAILRPISRKCFNCNRK